MRYYFDQFELDPNTHELVREGETVPLEPQTFKLLQTLIDNRDTVLNKEDLVDAVWQGRYTSDASIASRIKLARKALDDDGRTQRYIKTVHGVGYRFVGQVKTSQHTPVVSAGLDEPTQLSAARANNFVDSRPVILVRAFQSEPGDIVAGGLTHDIIVGLSRLRWLKVISWASAIQLQEESSGLVRTLTSADYNLCGSVIKQGKQLALNLELSDLKSGAVVWADRVESPDADINELRSNSIQQVINSLEFQISTAEASKAQHFQTSSLDAWASYHLGMLHMYRFNAEDNAIATQRFQRAIELEPNFARAHAGLSFAYFLSAFNRFPNIDHASANAGAFSHGERSVQLDDLDPMANFVMGRSFWLSSDIEASLPWLERSLTINHNFAQAHYSHGLAKVMLAQELKPSDEVHIQANSAITLSPLDPFTYGFYGLEAFAYLRDDNPEQATFWANRAARAPNAPVAMDFIAAAANSIAGDDEKASLWATRARQRSTTANSQYFFEALPFCDGPLRHRLQRAFDAVKLNDAKKS